MKNKQRLVRFIARLTTICMVVGIMLGSTNLNALAKTGSALDVGSPTFKNTDTLTYYNHGVDYTAGNMLKSIYDSDIANGGDSFYMDRVLERVGVADGDAGSNGNDDGNTFMTRGRALYMYTSNPAVIGFGGNTAYHQPLGKSSLYSITFKDGSTSLASTETTTSRVNMPSYWTSAYTLDSNVIARVSKFISYEDVAVTLVTLQNTGDTDKTLTMNVNSGFVNEKSTVNVNGVDQNELIGTLSSPSNLTTITARLTGDELSYNDTSASTLTGTVVIPAKGTKDIKVAMTFSTKELPKSFTDYTRFAGYDNTTALKTQKAEYNTWWNENTPYIDIPNKAIQKAIDYRWWLEKYNVVDANIPGYDYQYPVTIEGVLGYNNAIALTQPMHLQDTKWLRSAYLPYGTLLSMGNSSQSSAFLDNPGNRSNWNNHYGQYIATAGLEAYNVIGGNADIANTFAYYFEHDAKGQLDHYGNHTSASTPQQNLISYRNNYMTGNDADTISMHYAGAGTWKTHAENAYVYGAANAASKLYQLTNNTTKATELTTLAGAIQSDILNYLWCNQDSAFETRAVTPSSSFVVHNTQQPNLIPLKESNNFNYFSEYVVPTDAAAVEKYGKALEYLKYADEFPIFPYYTANQVDNKILSGSNNFSNINFTVQARAYEAALRTYDPTHQYVTPKMLSTMVEWCAWNMYPDGGDVRYPNNNEFFNFDGKTNDTYYRSWIYHNILGNFNYLFIEDMAGIRPRSDDTIELSPISFDYDYFMVNNVKYHSKDITIVWDKIDGTHKYGDSIPEGYSLYIDSKLVLNLDNLARVEYDPTTGDVTFPDPSSTANVITKETSSVPAAMDVELTETRVVDMFKKSGVDLTLDSENLAEGATVTASYTPTTARAASWAEKHRADGSDSTSKAVNETKPDPSAVVDGVTVNMPFWGNDKSTNASDYLELDLGSDKTIDMLNVFFYNDRQSGGYTEPGKYNIQYWDGTKWLHAENQTRTPGVTTANYNTNKFTAVTTNKVRLTFFNKPDHYTAVTEVQLFSEGGERPIVENTAPMVSLKVDESKNENLKAYLIGTCLDDGLPYDATLSYNWEILEQPVGAKAFFSNTNSLTPTIAVSIAGQYKVQLTANDGEKSTTVSVTADITESASVADKDVAPLAVASSDYTAGWENVTRVNDASNEPASSAPGTGKGWGNWGASGGTGSTHYLQYTWNDPVSIYKNDIYWYDDGGGTLIPKSISFQYLDSNNAWQNANMLTNFADAKVKNQYNNIEIEPITTKSIRMNCVMAAAGTGVLRWKTFATPINELLPTYVATKKGVIPTLPEYVYATMKDGSLTKAPVVWDSITAENVASDGTFSVSGINMDTGKFTSAEVTVRSDMDVATITDVYDTDVTVVAGKTPILPTTVKVKYNNGAIDNISVPVEWDATAVAAASAVGVHNLTGIGTVTGTATKANLILTVTGEKPVISKSALKTQIDAGNKLVQSAYTEATWTTFATALGNANTVYNNVDATQQMVDDTLAALKDAAGKLEFKPSDKIPELILHLDLNGNLTDCSKNNFSGQLATTDSAIWVDGIDGKALNFTGEDTSLDVPAGNNLLTPDITVSYWLKRTGTLAGDNNILWSKKDSTYNGKGFYTNYPIGQKYSSFFVVDDFNAFYVNEDPNVFLPENKWTHISVTWNSTKKQAAIYKDGVAQTITLEANPALISAPSDGTAVNRFGKSGYSGGYPIGMQIDDFRIYNADLNAEAVLGLYNEFTAPIASLATGTYDREQTVSLTSNTTAAGIYYTTDGSIPTIESTLYTGPIAVVSSLILSAIAVIGDFVSNVVSWVYTINAPELEQVAAPTATPAASNYTSVQIVTLATATAGASIYYTLDGITEPTTSSTLYSAPINVAASTVVKAIAVKTGMNNSLVSDFNYTINIPQIEQVAKPTASLAEGAYTEAQTVTLTTATAGASIYYTTDGITEPTTASTKYSAPINVASSTVIKAIAVKTGMKNSAVSTFSYTINIPDPVKEQVAKPTSSLAEGTYTEAKIVTLATATAGASIYYTTDGITEPTTASTLYSAPINVAASTVVKAIATKAGMKNSAVSTYSYTINISGGSTGGGSTSTPATQTPVITASADGKVIITNTQKVLNGTVVNEVSAAELDKALGKAIADKEGLKTVIIETKKVDNINKYVQKLPAETVSQIKQDKNIQIKTPVANLTVPSNMIKTSDAKDSKLVEIVIEAVKTAEINKEVQKQIGDRPIINLYASVDGKRIEWNNSSAPVTVEISYAPTAKELENPDGIVVYYIDGNNNLIAIPSGRYDKETGKVTFKTTHFSNYAISYSEKSFTDLTQPWAEKAINALYAKGIVEGRSENEFSPKLTITREESLAWLVRSLGITADANSNFDDVSDSKYSKEIAIAKALGITSGIGNNKFNPKKAITRQDLMTLIVNALDIAKKSLEKGTQDEISGYADASNVSKYAIESVATLVKSGIIVGSGKNINPKGNTTRAEAAVIMYKLYNK